MHPSLATRRLWSYTVSESSGDQRNAMGLQAFSPDCPKMVGDSRLEAPLAYFLI